VFLIAFVLRPLGLSTQLQNLVQCLMLRILELLALLDDLLLPFIFFFLLFLLSPFLLFPLFFGGIFLLFHKFFFNRHLLLHLYDFLHV